MRVLVHDYSGHPFQVQLSRWLAAQGETVLHAYSADIETPHGTLLRRPGDPSGFAVEPVSSGRALPKYQLLRRWLQERDYARRLTRRALAFGPDVVISTGPPAVQDALRRVAQRSGAGYVCWLQDIYGLAVAPVLVSRLRRPVGSATAALFQRFENAMLRGSDAVVSITEDFRPFLRRAGVSGEMVHVIPNWAPLDELPTLGRDNPWAVAHGLIGAKVFLYAGTLGLKHNPMLLLDLAEGLADDPDARVVVISQGPGRDLLEREKRQRGLGNLLLLDYQPFDAMPQVLASAEVLLALLEASAGVLSVPSKVLTYLTASRPILAAIPASNLAARTIRDAGAGLVVEPDDARGLLAAARRLRDDASLRATCADAGRRYAEAAFDIDGIGSSFREVLGRVARLARPGAA